MNRNRLGAVLILLACSASHADEPVTLKHLGGWVGAVAFAPKGDKVLVGASDGSIVVVDAADGKKLAALAGHDAAIATLAISPDGRWMISGAHDGRAARRELSPDLRDNGDPFTFYGHRGAVLASCFSNDSRRFFTGGVEGVLRARSAAGNQPPIERHEHTSWIHGLAVDPSGAMLASAGSDNSVRLWRTKDLSLLHRFHVKEGEVRSVAFSPDSKLLAAGIRYGWVRAWDVESKKELASMKAHAGETWAVAFTPDGKTLASAGGDWHQPGEVRLWDTANWNQRATLKHTGEVLSLAISGDGLRLAAGSWDRSVRIWNLRRILAAPTD